MTIADRLRYAKMGQQVRDSLEGAIVRALDNRNWRIRKCALLSAREAGIADREDMRERIQNLVNDDVGEIAELARELSGND